MEARVFFPLLVGLGLVLVGLESASATLEPHHSISIPSDDSFLPINPPGDPYGSGVRFGSGTENDPYVIENWLISAPPGGGILITNTTAYFVIRHCRIENGKNCGSPGIRFLDIRNGRVENCTVENNGYALVIENSSDILVSNNLFEDMEGEGIRIWSGSSNIRIENCIVESSLSGYGIEIQDSSNIRIENSGIRSGSDKSGGIRLQGQNSVVENVVLLNNLVENVASAGIQVETARNLTIGSHLLENTCFGIQIRNAENVDVYANTIANQRYGIVLENVHQSKIRANILENYQDVGIRLVSSSANNTIASNHLQGGGADVEIGSDCTFNSFENTQYSSLVGKLPRLKHSSIFCSSGYDAVGWFTQENSTSVVEYGPDESYGLTASGEAGTVHIVSLPIPAGGQWHFRVVSEESVAHNREISGGLIFCERANNQPPCCVLAQDNRHYRVTFNITNLGDSGTLSLRAGDWSATLPISSENTSFAVESPRILTAGTVQLSLGMKGALSAFEPEVRESDLEVEVAIVPNAQTVVLLDENFEGETIQSLRGKGWKFYSSIQVNQGQLCGSGGYATLPLRVGDHELEADIYLPAGSSLVILWDLMWVKEDESGTSQGSGLAVIASLGDPDALYYGDLSAGVVYVLSPAKFEVGEGAHHLKLGRSGRRFCAYLDGELWIDTENDEIAGEDQRLTLSSYYAGVDNLKISCSGPSFSLTKVSEIPLTQPKEVKFTWSYTDAENFPQARHLIQVGTSEGGADLWNYAGEGGQTGIMYGGSKLKPGRIYYARLAVADLLDPGLFGPWFPIQFLRPNTPPRLLSLDVRAGEGRASASYSDLEGDPVERWEAQLWKFSSPRALVWTGSGAGTGITFPVPPAGNYELRARIFDGGDWSEWASVGFSIEHVAHVVPPRISLHSPRLAGETITLRRGEKEKLAVAGSYEYLRTESSSPFVESWASGRSVFIRVDSSCPSGEYTVKITACGAGGTDTHTISVRVPEEVTISPSPSPSNPATAIAAPLLIFVVGFLVLVVARWSLR